MKDSLHLLAHASSGYGDLGNQTGKEISTRLYYNAAGSGGWGRVFRFKDETYADKAADMQLAAIMNGYIGYSNSYRMSSFLSEIAHQLGPSYNDFYNGKYGTYEIFYDPKTKLYSIKHTDTNGNVTQRTHNAGKENEYVDEYLRYYGTASFMKRFWNHLDVTKCRPWFVTRESGTDCSALTNSSFTIATGIFYHYSFNTTNKRITFGSTFPNYLSLSRSGSMFYRPFCSGIWSDYVYLSKMFGNYYECNEHTYTVKKKDTDSIVYDYVDYKTMVEVESGNSDKYDPVTIGDIYTLDEDNPKYTGVTTTYGVSFNNFNGFYNCPIRLHNVNFKLGENGDPLATTPDKDKDIDNYNEYDKTHYLITRYLYYNNNNSLSDENGFPICRNLYRFRFEPFMDEYVFGKIDDNENQEFLKAYYYTDESDSENYGEVKYYGSESGEKIPQCIYICETWNEDLKINNSKISSEYIKNINCINGYENDISSYGSAKDKMQPTNTTDANKYEHNVFILNSSYEDKNGSPYWNVSNSASSEIDETTGNYSNKEYVGNYTFGTVRSSNIQTYNISTGEFEKSSTKYLKYYTGYLTQEDLSAIGASNEPAQGKYFIQTTAYLYNTTTKKIDTSKTLKAIKISGFDNCVWINKGYNKNTTSTDKLFIWINVERAKMETDNTRETELIEDKTGFKGTRYFTYDGNQYVIPESSSYFTKVTAVIKSTGRFCRYWKTFNSKGNVNHEYIQTWVKNENTSTNSSALNDLYKNQSSQSAAQDEDEDDGNEKDDGSEENYSSDNSDNSYVKVWYERKTNKKSVSYFEKLSESEVKALGIEDDIDTDSYDEVEANTPENGVVRSRLNVLESDTNLKRGDILITRGWSEGNTVGGHVAMYI